MKTFLERGEESKRAGEKLCTQHYLISDDAAYVEIDTIMNDAICQMNVSWKLRKHWEPTEKK
jgi:hypothetical protein